MAHSFFKFDFGRDGMPGNMGQANWQRLAKYVKKAQSDDPDAKLDKPCACDRGCTNKTDVSGHEYCSECLSGCECNPSGEEALYNEADHSYMDRDSSPDDNESDAGNGPWACACGCGCSEKHWNPTGSYCRDCAVGNCGGEEQEQEVHDDGPDIDDLDDVKGILKSHVRGISYLLKNFDEYAAYDDDPSEDNQMGGYIGNSLEEVERSLLAAHKMLESGRGDANLRSVYDHLSKLVSELDKKYYSNSKKARVAHRVWDIVSNDGIPTAHRKVDEMTVINRDHKRLADTSEIDVGDQVVMFTDGVRVQARIASIQNDGNVVLNVNGTLVPNVDPGFVFLDE